MPRPRRAFFDGLFHLAAHGSDTRFLYVTDTDRERFLVFLATAFGRHGLTPVSYTLMGNHYHVILNAPDARVSRAMQQLHTRYSRRHNQTHERSAHLFRAHFAANEITSDEQLITAVRYLALNPVAAGLAASAVEWPWSSARAHAGLETLRSPSMKPRCAPRSTTIRTGANATSDSCEPSRTRTDRKRSSRSCSQARCPAGPSPPAS